MTPQSALPPEVVRLRNKAEEHKRNEGRERRAARRTMAELETVCVQLGIRFREVKPNGKVHTDKVNDPSSSD